MNLKQMVDEANRTIAETVRRMDSAFTTEEWQLMLITVTGDPRKPQPSQAEHQLKNSGLVVQREDGTWVKADTASGSANAHLSCLRGIVAPGQQKWDLSLNDVAAIRWALDRIEELSGEVE